MKNEIIYTIPGWGFSANILSHGALADKTSFGINYFNYSQMTIEDIAVTLSKNIKDSATVVAWSLGGIFAIKIASLFPGKIRKLILLASQPRLLTDIGYAGIDLNVISAFIESANQNFYELRKKFIAEVNFPNKNFLYEKILNNHFLDDFYEQLKYVFKLFLTDLRDEYRHLNNDVLHIIGDKDVVLKQDEQCLLAMNRHIRVAHVEGAGHCGFLTHAFLYRDIIDRFIL